MGDFEAVPLEVAAEPVERIAGRLEEARELANGLLFVLLVLVVGTLLVTATLVIGVVGSPVLAAGAGYLVVRRRRAAKQRAFAAFRPRVA
jgi:hypothetical protein